MAYPKEQSNFQSSVESNPDCICFVYYALPDWFRKLAAPTQPVICKTKTNRDLITRVFPRVRPFTCIYFELSLFLVMCTLVLIGRCDYFFFILRHFNNYYTQLLFSIKVLYTDLPNCSTRSELTLGSEGFNKSMSLYFFRLSSLSRQQTN